MKTVAPPRETTTVTTDREQIRQRFLQLNTAIVCDVYDELGWPVTALHTDIRRRTFERARVAGWAYPIEGQLSPATGPDRLKLEVADALPAGCVTVWGGANASGICLFGDLIAATMAKRGCHGAVVDGGFRDLEAISGTGFPVFARYVSPVQSVGRWRVTRHAEPIVVRGALGGLVTVSPDDLVLGDEDGVVVVQAERVREVLERAEAIVRQEAEARKLSEEGMTAQEMLERFGHV